MVDGKSQLPKANPRLLSQMPARKEEPQSPAAPRDFPNKAKYAKASLRQQVEVYCSLNPQTFEEYNYRYACFRDLFEKQESNGATEKVKKGQQELTTEYSANLAAEVDLDNEDYISQVDTAPHIDLQTTKKSTLMEQMTEGLKSLQV